MVMLELIKQFIIILLNKSRETKKNIFNNYQSVKQEFSAKFTQFRKFHLIQVSTKNLEAIETMDYWI